GQPIFRHRAESFDHLGEFAWWLVGDFAALARLEVGCERLAAALHGPREVHREGFGVELFRNLGFGRNVAHIRNTIGSFQVSHRAGSMMAGSRLISPSACCTATKHLGSDILKPQGSALLSGALIVSGDNGLKAPGI